MVSPQPATPSSQRPRLPRLPLSLRITATALSILLFLTSSPPLLAITMGQIRAGSATPGGGGQGSFSNLQNAGAASAALTAAMAQGNLKKANNIISAIKQAQADARKNVSLSSVPNGLIAGGLEVHNPTGQVVAGNVPANWSGVSSLAEKRLGSSSKVDITQNQQNAYLYWNKFNVGSQTTVNFNLADNLKANPGQNIAFNKVMSSSDPSHIFGKINAEGQVYILNQNGILFHNGSAVNTRSLVASTLPINENLAGDALKGIKSQGLMNNPDAQFLFSSVKLDANPNYSSSKGFKPDNPPEKGIGNVVVERGARITAPVDNNNSGGLVALLGPSVLNDGEINTPNGQTILAAGLQVGLKAHDASDPSLRGLDVYVGRVTDPSVNSMNIVDGTVDTEASKGVVRNGGIISAFLGNAIMAGKTVVQNGGIESSTSVSLNGRVDLLASYGTVVNTAFNPTVPSGALLQYQDTGLVDLGVGSVISILPEWKSSEKVVGGELALKSIVSIIAGNAHLGEGGMIVAPGASRTDNAVSQVGVKLDHGIGIDAFSWQDDGSGNPSRLYSSGQIYLDSGAIIEASGSTGVAVDSSQNYLTLQLRGSELANSPLQRTSVVRGKDITVDIRNNGSYGGQYWVGTALGDVTGYVNLIQRPVGQLTIAGGDVSLRAGDAVVISEHAAINISGGWERYSGGSFSTTKLISSTGQIVDISEVRPDQVYTGIFKSSESYYEAPYLSGGNGGALSIQAPSMALDGEFHGTTVAGYRQLRPSPGTTVPSVLPSPTSLSLSFLGQTFDQTLKQSFSKSPFSPRIEISEGPSSILDLPLFRITPEGSVADLPVDASFRGFVSLNSEIFGNSGFGFLTIDNRNGKFSIGKDVVLSLGMNGALDVLASNIGIDGKIESPGGKVTLQAEAVNHEFDHALAIFSQSNVRTQPLLDVLELNNGETVLQYGAVADSGTVGVMHEDGTLSTITYRDTMNSLQTGRGSVVLGSHAHIITAGELASEVFGSQNAAPIVTSAGAVAVRGVRTTLMPGSVLDVSGGAFVSIGAKAVLYGNAGSISLSGGQDDKIPTIHGGKLEFIGSDLRGYGFLSPTGVGGAAGSLTLNASAIRIGTPLPDVADGLLTIDSTFFDKGGFSKFNLSGTGIGLSGERGHVAALSIAAFTLLVPSVEARRLAFQNGSMVMEEYVPTANVGYAPSLSLSALGLVDDKLPPGHQLLASGDLSLEEGSSIILQPKLTQSGGLPVATGGSLNLSGMMVEIPGMLSAPGGLISISGAADLIMNDIEASRRNPHVTVDLAPTARISTTGVALYSFDPKRIRSSYGSVLGGGNVSISGNIIARSGSQIDASGATGTFDDYGKAPAYRVDTSGGVISIRGGQSFYSDAIFSSRSGGATAAGGGLVVSTGRFYKSGETKLPTDLSLELVQSAGIVPAGLLLGSEIPFSGTEMNGGGHLSADSFASGGFDSITMSGNVMVNGSISIQATKSISFATGGILSANDRVTLNASYISLGRSFANPLAPSDAARTTVLGSLTDPIFAPPTYGTGKLDVTASLIDLGNISLSSIGSAYLDAGNGSIRGDGTFAMAGDLTLSASRVYPVTGVDFTMVAFNHDGANRAVSGGGTSGSITIKKTVDASGTILSAGGNISVQSSIIDISGNLRAPFGVIRVGSSSGIANAKDPISGLSAPDTVNLDISGRISVSGAGSTVLYGTSSDGTSWIAPSGLDISNLGVVGKGISLNGIGSIFSLGSDSQLDVSGGGDLVALRWISGLGGTINWIGSASKVWSAGQSYTSGDLVNYQGSVWSSRFGSKGQAPAIGGAWSQLPESYAILPGYDQDFAPTGYADGSLGVGSRIWLEGGGGLAKGSYSLLPAIYATQPGAYLISVETRNRDTQLPVSIVREDATALVSGTLYNGFSSLEIPASRTLFSVSSPQLVSQKVDYSKLVASEFFKEGISSTREAGKLSISSLSKFEINARVDGGGFRGGRGALIDLKSPGSFVIGLAGTGDVILNPSVLANWSYGSLLIGGGRDVINSSGMTPVSVAANRITLDPGVNLTVSDIILAAKEVIQFGSHSGIAAGTQGSAPDEKISTSGNGVMVRVSNDSNVTLARTLVPEDGSIALSIGENVTFAGSSVILDSSSSLQMTPSTKLNAPSVILNARAVALVLDNNLIADDSSGRVVLAGTALDGLAASKNLNITSYSTLDIYGAGSFGSDSMESLGLHAGKIRGFNLNGETASFTAQTIALDNYSGASSAGAVSGSIDGCLELNAATITLGKNALHIDQFANVSLNSKGVVAGTSSGSLSIGTSELPANLFITTPLITSIDGNSLMVTASGDLTLQDPDLQFVTATKIQPGAGATLSFTGTTVTANTTLSAPSGKISIHATSGDVNVGGGGIASLDVSGVSKTIQTAAVTADAGSISIQSDAGNVNLGPNCSLHLSASGSSSAGTLLISAPVGTLALDANSILNATGGSAGGANGVFSMDVSTLDATGQGVSLLSSIIPQLSPDENDIGGFTKSLSFRIRSGDVDVDTLIKSMAFSLSVDQGLIDVTSNGVIDASGPTGGKISLQASGSVILEPNSFLNVHGDSYDNAGKGGSVFLSAGAQIGARINPDAVLDMRTASSIDLGVTATTSRPDQFGGTLHLRAPITADGADIQVASLDATITGASSIAVEGYRLYELTGTSGEITQSLRDSIYSNASESFGSSGADSSAGAATLLRLTANQDPALLNILSLSPGVEIVNRSGDLTLNTDWDLSGFRTGEKGTPGFLTLRAEGNIIFNASLSDGFDSSVNTARLLPRNANLAANFQSWSYQVAAGSDTTAVDPAITDISKIGSINLGKAFPNGPNVAISPGNNALTSDAIEGYFQVIRTGTGEIALNASRDVTFWNQFATVYTAGVQVEDPTLGGVFDTPRPNFSKQGEYLGIVQQGTDEDGYVLNTPQFSQGGGNIFINASRDISHKALGVDGSGTTVVVDDSVRQVPSNWLYRRGSVDGKTGVFEKVSIEGLSGGDIASTSWWVDFSNFFEGVAALGGGNISLNAGRNIANVDALIPTNLRMPGRDSLGTLVKAGEASPSELGGGDLRVQSAGNIDGGIYYVERGLGSLKAGGSIVTNRTRDPQAPLVVYSLSPQSDPNSYMPTSVFLGKGNFDIAASGDVLLGTVANVFLTPQGINNGYWYKNYFSTYSPQSGVQIQSVGGNILMRAAAVSPAHTFSTPMLQLWMEQFTQPSEIAGMAYYQPWIRLAESDLSDLGSLMSISAPNQRIASFNGSISLQGGIEMMPSSSGNITMIAGKGISGLSPMGVNSVSQLWGTSVVNLSDADPSLIPGINNPLSQRSVLADEKDKSINNIEKTQFTGVVSSVFSESGSYSGNYGILSTKQNLHATSLLHRIDSRPAEFLTGNGNISGLTLYSPKRTLVHAGGDISDVGLYIQNNTVADVSEVTAGGSITLFDPSSPLQIKAQYDMRSLSFQASKQLLSSGDIQISGPGALVVTAGGNIDLGNGPNNADGTGVGITSIGNSRNPALPFEGADMQLMTGVKAPESLGADKILASAASAKDSSRFFKEVSDALMQTGNNGLVDAFLTMHSWDELINSDKVGDDIKSRIAMVLFDILLRDTGRDFNEPNSPNYRSYASGEQAIDNLFGVDYQYTGSVITWSRDLRTKNGGSITINAPGGGVTLANTTIGSTLAPPGIVTEHGGAINIFTKENVDIGIGRIFTLQGGDIMIWSDKGNIAAGSSAKTVASAPPTRVLIDPQSAAVVIDLAGLATGGGIGVLATVKDAPVGNVDLIAPSGYIDAGDAGIRASGNLTLAAPVIKNANNISAASTKGAPPAVAAPATAAPPASANTAAAANNKASQTISKNNASGQADETPSIYSIDILGYGGGDEDEEKKAADATVAPVQAAL